jgi:hypothetical protein
MDRPNDTRLKLGKQDRNSRWPLDLCMPRRRHVGAYIPSRSSTPDFYQTTCNSRVRGWICRTLLSGWRPRSEDHRGHRMGAAMAGTRTQGIRSVTFLQTVRMANWSAVMALALSPNTRFTISASADSKLIKYDLLVFTSLHSRIVI